MTRYYPAGSARVSLAVSSNRIEVWYFDLDSVAHRVEELSKTLLPEEYERAMRFRTETLRNRSIAGQWALRRLLAEYLAVSPAEPRFERGEYGKPRLAGTQPDQGLVFNVSHTGGHALFAVGRDLALGVDIEHRRGLGDLEGMVERCLAPEEQDYWQALPETRKSLAFFDFWTCKEAFVKAVGQGLGLGLARCVVAPGDPTRLVSVPEGYGPAEQWSLWRIDLGGELSAALCAKTRAARLHVRNFRELAAVSENSV